MKIDVKFTQEQIAQLRQGGELENLAADYIDWCNRYIVLNYVELIKINSQMEKLSNSALENPEIALSAANIVMGSINNILGD